MLRQTLLSLILLLTLAPLALAEGPLAFRITLDAAANSQPVSGRLIVMLLREGANVQPGQEPLDGPFWTDPQPLLGTNVTSLAPGASIELPDAGTISFPQDLSTLPPGKYTAQARLDVQRRSSSWRDHDGNLFGPAVAFTLPASGPVALTLNQRTSAPEAKAVAGAEFFEVRSELLSTFYGKDTFVRAGVMFPVNHDPSKAYPVIYEVPGFGGDHISGINDRIARRRMLDRIPPQSPARKLAESAFWIVLDPEGPNGHTLFADSANNGPRGRALVEELIPALEKKFNLQPRAQSRILRGHSSGGWSVLWLLTTYPEVFGAAFSTGPDPVDFRRFQVVDIYSSANMFTDDAGKDRPSYVKAGKTLMTIRQENAGENVIGPDTTSAQQWASWQAVFGPRTSRGTPAALFDPVTGAINRAVAEQYKAFDIAARFRADPARFGPILRDRARIVVGDQDEFALHQAVELLATDLAAWTNANPAPAGTPTLGGITILPGKDHGTVLGSPPAMQFSAQMLELLAR